MDCVDTLDLMKIMIDYKSRSYKVIKCPRCSPLQQLLKISPSGVVGALPLSREARVQFPAGELGSHQISPDGVRAGNLMRPRIGWGLPLVPDPIQSWRFREVYARKPRGPSLHRLGKIDAICTCIGTSDVKLMEFQSINGSGSVAQRRWPGILPL